MILELIIYTGCPKSFGHILTLDISKTVKDITMHLIYCESLRSQVDDGMFNVSTVGHTAHIKAKVQLLPNASKRCVLLNHIV